MLRLNGPHFIDERGRRLLLRGVNLGASSKTPGPDGTFIGKPLELAHAAEHLDRLKSWGLTTLRLLTTWEAVEHEGPGRYDLAYLDYLEALTRLAAERGHHVFIDFHQDVWSRFTGGDGAPRWTLEAAGLNPETLHETGAAFLEAEHRGPLPKMIWPTNVGKLACASMFTLFFGGDVFAPRRAGLQRELQERFFGAMEQVVRRVAPFVFGVDVMNEPSCGFIGWSDLTRHGGPVEVGAMPSAVQGMALGDGACLTVPVLHRGVLGVRTVDHVELNPRRLRAWQTSCPWRDEGVWSEGPRVDKPRHFTHVNGREVSFVRDFYKPFLVEAARRVHAIDANLVVMLESEPFHPGPEWSPADGAPVAYAPHWYDGYVLFMKDYRSFLAVDSFTQKPVFGASRIRKSFERQLRRLTADARGMPMIVGELGIAFDLKRGGQVEAMNRTLTAVEDAQVNATLWNYNAENTRARGDGWNGEDLSIFSDGEGRALEAVVRPRPVAIAGELVRFGFDLKARRFELTVRPDVKCAAPTEVFVVGGEAQVSEGRVERDGDTLSWHHDSAREQTLRVKQIPSPPWGRGSG